MALCGLALRTVSTGLMDTVLKLFVMMLTIKNRWVIITYEVYTWIAAAGVWTIVLTPNYNAAHRNHFHVDLTPGSDYLRSYRGVDDGPDRH